MKDSGTAFRGREICRENISICFDCCRGRAYASSRERKLAQ